MRASTTRRSPSTARAGAQGIDGVLAARASASRSRPRPRPRRTPTRAARPRGRARRVQVDAARREGPARRVRALSPGPDAGAARQARRGQDARSRRPRTLGKDGRASRLIESVSPHSELVKRATLVLAAALAAARAARACPSSAPMRCAPSATEPLGEDRLRCTWKFVTADRRDRGRCRRSSRPPASMPTRSTLARRTAGSTRCGRERRRALAQEVRLGRERAARARRLALHRHHDGVLIALDAQTGVEKWRYQSRGPIQQPPVATSRAIVFANEADQVFAVDAITGKFKWQYKGETPEEYTLRGHAGVTSMATWSTPVSRTAPWSRCARIPARSRGRRRSRAMPIASSMSMLRRS